MIVINFELYQTTSVQNIFFFISMSLLAAEGKRLEYE